MHPYCTQTNTQSNSRTPAQWTHTDTHRHTDTQTHRHTHRHTHTHTPNKLTSLALLFICTQLNQVNTSIVCLRVCVRESVCACFCVFVCESARAPVFVCTHIRDLRYRHKEARDRNRNTHELCASSKALLYGLPLACATASLLREARKSDIKLVAQAVAQGLSH